MFVDASALVAEITSEPERDDIRRLLTETQQSFTSPIALFEASLAVARKMNRSLLNAFGDVSDLVEITGIEVIAVEARDAERAVEAAARFGKGSGHPARLNMGDCFAYAMAVNRGLPLLFKGDDFGQTDVARVAGAGD